MLRRGRTIPGDRASRKELMGGARTPPVPASPVSVSDESDPGASDPHSLSARSKHAMRTYNCAARKYEANEMEECLELLEEALAHNPNCQPARDLQHKVYALHRIGRSPAWANCAVTKSCPTLFQASSSSSSSSSNEWGSSACSSRGNSTTAVDGPAGMGGELNGRHFVPMPFASISPGTRRTLFSDHRGSRHSSPDSVKSSHSTRSRGSSRRRSSSGRRGLAVHKSVDSVPLFQLGKSSSFSEGLPSSRARGSAGAQHQALMRTKSSSFAQQMSALSPMAPRGREHKSSRDSKRLRLSLDSVGSVGPFHFNGMSETLDEDDTAALDGPHPSEQRSRSGQNSRHGTPVTARSTVGGHQAPEISALLHDPDRTTGYSPTFTGFRENNEHNVRCTSTSSIAAAGGAPTPEASTSPLLPRSRQRTPKLQDESPDSLLEFRRSTSEASLLPGTDPSFISPQPFPQVLSTPKLPGSACSTMSGIEGPALTESPDLLLGRRSTSELGSVRRRFDRLEVEEQKDPVTTDARSVSMEEIDATIKSPGPSMAIIGSSSSTSSTTKARPVAASSAHAMHIQQAMHSTIQVPTSAKRSDPGIPGGLPRRQIRKAKHRDRLLALPSSSSSSIMNGRAQRNGKENGTVSYNHRSATVKQCAKTPARHLGAPPCFETPTRDQQFQLASAQFEPALVVKALRSAGIFMLALDFDNTLIDTHTKGQFRGAIEDLNIRPIFLAIVPAVLKAGIALSIVTFSPQVDVVKRLLDRTFPECELGKNTFVCGAQHTSVSKSDNMSPNGAPICCSPRRAGKSRHVALVCKEHAFAVGCETLKESQVLLVDDDKNNIDSAKRYGIQALWFRADRGPSAAEYQLYLDLQRPM
ncbi:Hypothetical Protein FCC1311_074892 [Hondaea fermentalgiana]|uniref:Uncharacterized protein n=1 Tax=Hondaea fermentalgiana TaxID=2315210 RepID=A0A2R5GNE9_9STRA|nr:Hypothetical Protein FCC1311_074892 [Hondaea fermentalgiana]|eukprot:GBG31268.1 Hypothetical Protein FCC1311_074892 [Hondaea fermentalgiana]